MEALWFTLFFIGLSLIDGSGDAARSKRHASRINYLWSWLSQDFLTMGIFVGMAMGSLYALSLARVALYLAGYTLIRLPVLNLSFNITANIPWYYLNASKPIDRILIKIRDKHSHFLLWIYIFSFLFGLVCTGFWEWIEFLQMR